MKLKLSFRKILTVIATFATLANSLSAPAIALAQEVTPAPTPTDTSTPSDQPTVAPTENPTVTPDATPAETIAPTPEVTTAPAETSTPAPTDQPVVTQAPESNPTTTAPPATETPAPTLSATPTASPNPTENESLTTQILTTNVFPQTVQDNSWLKLITDKLDYSPTDMVVISGSGFIPNKDYSLEIVSTDAPPVDFTTQVKADSWGNISYTYQLDGNYRPNYTVYIKNGVVVVMTTTFTDTSLKKDFAQCANNDSPTPAGQCHWIGSALQNSNSDYGEGMTVPQRIVFTDIPATTGNIHTLTFSHQATKGGIHAYDFLTAYNQSDNPALVLNSCNDLGSLSSACNTLHSSSNISNVDVPDDPFISKDGSTQTRINSYESVFGNRQIKIYANNAISGASLVINSHSVSNGGDTGDSEINYTLTWTSSSPDILIEMAGHLAVGGNGSGYTWGSGLGSASVSGGPYHFKLNQLDGGAIGSQDNQIQTGAIILPGNIIINKNTIGADGTFDYSTTGGSTVPASFSITTSGNTGSQTYSNALAGTYTITENTPSSGFNLTNLTCNDPTNNSSVDLSLRKATIVLGAGETVTCTYTNTYTNPTGTLKVKKLVINDNGGTSTPSDFSFQVGTGTITPFTQIDSTHGENDLTVNAGSYSITEPSVAGYATTYNNCSNVTVPNGGSATCTITNDDIAPTLKLVKNISVGSSIPHDWTLSAQSNGAGGFSDWGDSTTFHPVNANISYALSENGGTLLNSEYTASKWTCDNGITVTSSAITLPLAKNVTCTITNSQNHGTITVHKDFVGTPTGYNNFCFTLSPDPGNGQVCANDNGDAVFTNVPAGDYTATETQKLDAYTQSGTTCDTTMSIVNNGDSKSCTITNTRNQGTVELKKIWSGTPGQTTLNIGTSAGTSNIASVTTGVSGGDPLTTNTINVDTGAYYVSETGGLTNYTPELDCTDNGTPFTPVTGNGFTVHTGDAVVCTFTNTRNTGTITIVKNTLGGDDTFNFGVTGETASSQTIPTSGGTGTVGPLIVNTGDYSVSENSLPAGWLPNGADCFNGNTDLNGTSFTVAKGDSIVCTFNNKKEATIIIKKVMVGDTGTFNFTGTPSWLSGSISANNGTLEFNNVTPKTGVAYTTTETPVTGWQLTDISCDDGSSVQPSSGNVKTGTASFYVDPGETVTCTFTNTKLPTLTINKVLSPNTDGGLFNLQIDGSTAGTGTNVGDGGSTGAITLTLSAHTFGETAGTGTDLSNYTSAITGEGCGTDGTIDLAAGQDAVCTITNTRNTGIINVHKMVDQFGTGTYSGNDALATTLGFRWGLDPTPSNNTFTFGNGQTENTGDYQIYENNVSDYHFTGWFTGDSSCNRIPENQRTLPASISVTNGNITTITLCNARDTGTLIVNKLADSQGNGNYTVDTQNFTWGTVLGTTNYPMGSGQTLVTGNYDIFENGPTQYKLTGWFYGNPENSDFSCAEPEFQGLPTNINVSTEGNEITLCNQAQLPKISIAKTNDSGSGISAGSNVTYNLVVTNSGNLDLYNVLVTDFLPGGFSYITGSVTGATLVSSIGSKLEFRIDNIDANSSATITYQVSTNSSLANGDYLNFASCTAAFGEEDRISCGDPVNSKVTIGSGLSYGGNLQGQVLGASTELPATGSPTGLLAAALGILGVGLILGGVSLRREYKNAKN